MLKPSQPCFGPGEGRSLGTGTRVLRKLGFSPRCDGCLHLALGHSQDMRSLGLLFCASGIFFLCAWLEAGLVPHYWACFSPLQVCPGIHSGGGLHSRASFTPAECLHADTHTANGHRQVHSPESALLPFEVYVLSLVMAASTLVGEHSWSRGARAGWPGSGWSGPGIWPVPQAVLNLLLSRCDMDQASVFTQSSRKISVSHSPLVTLTSFHISYEGDHHPVIWTPGLVCLMCELKPMLPLIL